MKKKIHFGHQKLGKFPPSFARFSDVRQNPSKLCYQHARGNGSPRICQIRRRIHHSNGLVGFPDGISSALLKSHHCSFGYFIPVLLNSYLQISVFKCIHSFLFGEFTFLIVLKSQQHFYFRTRGLVNAGSRRPLRRNNWRLSG